jgi:hypothetical protein
MLVWVVAVGVVSLAPTPAAGADLWLRPVGGRVVRAFAAPLTRYGAGHLGVDFAAAPGTAVHAAGAGTVVFAGVVANTRHVVVRHAGGRRTSYSFLASIRVHRGDTVARGAVLGTAGGRGENHAAGVLHFGLRIGAVFVDPMRLFAPGALPVRVHLAPVDLSPERSTGPIPERNALVAGGAAAAVPVVLRRAEPTAGPGLAAVPICARLVALHRLVPSGAPFRPG